MDDPVVDRVRRRAKETGLLEAGALVLLSGGRDSVCLLDVAVALAGATRVRALHVAYGLRDGAEGDAEHCAGLCTAFGVPLDVERPDPPGETGNVQAWAREVRYAACGRPPATRRPTRSRPCSTASRPRPAAGRCSGWTPRRPQWSVRC